MPKKKASKGPGPLLEGGGELHPPAFSQADANAARAAAKDEKIEADRLRLITELEAENATLRDKLSKMKPPKPSRRRIPSVEELVRPLAQRFRWSKSEIKRARLVVGEVLSHD